jgi:hypothetical protein
MSYTLENLSAALVSQFQKLRNNPQTNAAVLSNNAEYKISNVGVTVLVNMTSASRIPEGVQFCDGMLYCSSVSVLVFPPNNDVESAIATHFKNQIRNQIIPAMTPPTNQICDVFVNNKQII